MLTESEKRKEINFNQPIAAVNYVTFDEEANLKLPDLLRLGLLKYPNSEFSTSALMPFSSANGILFVTSNDEQKNKANFAMQAIAFRLMLSTPTKQSHFYIIDNEGNGQSFSNLFGLDKKIVEGEVWDDDYEIVKGLQEIKNLIPKIVSENLTTKYSNLAQYNKLFPNSNIPFRFIMVANYPRGFNSEAQQHLVSIMKNGSKAGIFVIASFDKTVKSEYNYNPSDIYNIGVEYEMESNTFNNLPSSEYFNSKFYLLFLFFAIALGSIFPTYIRLELSYDLFHTRSIFLSYIYRYFISYIELLLPCSFLIFIFNFINKIPISLRILLIFLFSLFYYAWWWSNLLEYRLLGYTRITNIHSLFILYNSKKFIFSSAIIGIKLIDIIIFIFSQLGFILFLIVFSIKIKHTRIRNTFNLTCFLISSLISILFLIFDSYRRDKLNLSIEVITNRFNNKYWTTTLISTQAPFLQIYKLAQQINTLNNAPKCKEIKLTKSIIKFKNKSKNKISLIGIQLESINKNIIQAKFNNNKLVMPFLNNILNYSNYLNPKFNLLSERNTAASEFSSLCAIDTPSFEPFENISRFQRYCLPKILNEHSWNTYTAHANSLDFYNRGEAYPRLGFQHILSLKDFSKLELPSNSIGLLDWPVFDEVVKNIPWENSNNFLHFVTLQSHSPFDPSNGTKYHLDMSSYFSGSIDQNILNRYANAAYEVDEFMKKSVKLLQNISLKLDVNFILYFYGDHAPPIRSNLFQDAKLLSMDARKLLVHDGTVPFGVLNIKYGILNIL